MPWKTITGAVIAAIGYLSQPEVFAVLPEKLASLVTAAGALLSAVGVRHAIAKSSIARIGR